MPLDLDRELFFSCPNGCGQIAVACSLKGILDNQDFFCDACGCQFQGSLCPDWLDNASHLAFSRDDQAHFALLKDYYKYCYANGPIPTPRHLNALLDEYPQYWRLFPCSTLSVERLLKILNHPSFQEDPNFLEQFPWQQLSGRQWCILLKRRPTLVQHCPWDQFDATQWSELLTANPRFASHCDWQKFTPQDWCVLLQQHPKLFNHCHTQNWTSHDWAALLAKAPIFADKCHDWKHFRPEEWLAILNADPALASHCECWNDFPGEAWPALLKLNPDFSTRCDWKKLRGEEWRTLLLDDLRNRSAYLARHGGVLPEGTLSFAYDDLCHPWYLAIYSYLHGTQILAALEKFPALAAQYLDWDRLQGEEWLACFAEKPDFAANCRLSHWRTIVEHINQLPENQRYSVKNCNSGCWQKRLEILNHADTNEISQLAPEEFYTLVDFMDWEWDSHFHWDALDKAGILRLASKHPEFLEKYGLENFTPEELRAIANLSPAMRGYLVGQITASPGLRTKISRPAFLALQDALLKTDPNLLPQLQDHLLLSWSDLREFNYHGLNKLRHKVARYRIFVTQLAVFLVGGIALLFGPTGYLAFRAEHPEQAPASLLTCAALALFWSAWNAWLHQYFGGPTLSRFLGLVTGLTGLVLYAASFFLTAFNRPAFWCFILFYIGYLWRMLECRRSAKAKLLAPPPNNRRRRR